MAIGPERNAERHLLRRGMQDAQRFSQLRCRLPCPLLYHEELLSQIGITIAASAEAPRLRGDGEQHCPDRVMQLDRKTPSLLVNGHLCEMARPFCNKPSPRALRAALGDCFNRPVAEASRSASGAVKNAEQAVADHHRHRDHSSQTLRPNLRCRRIVHRTRTIGRTPPPPRSGAGLFAASLSAFPFAGPVLGLPLRILRAKISQGSLASVKRAPEHAHNSREAAARQSRRMSWGLGVRRALIGRLTQAGGLRSGSVSDDGPMV